MGEVVLITGASSGIGAACARLLARNGYSVYGTSRRERTGDGFTMLRMDVADAASVAAGIETIISREGRIDAVVNNAGIGIAGPVEETTVEEAEALFAVDFFGVLRVARAVLPHMRRRGGGTIVNVSSIAGRIGLPYQGLYSAAKFAVEGLSEALRLEVRQFGIRVVLIEPGDFHTGFTANRRKIIAADSPYADSFSRAIGVAEKDELSGASPEAVARLLLRILRSRSPRPRYTAGAPFQRFAAFAKGIIPGRMFERALGLYYRVS